MATESQESPRLRLVVVCHQLRSAENLGAIARVMANFGHAELVLSDAVVDDRQTAERVARRADPVLAAMRSVATLDEALAGVVYALGTTSRTSIRRQEPVAPEAGVARLVRHAARGPVALVLGGERRGLDDEELARCQDVVAIPTPGPQPSMNISHAAAVMLYLVSRAAASVEAGPEGAPLGLVHLLEPRLKELLELGAFVNPQAPEQVLNELSRALVRGGITRREAELWLGALSHLLRLVRGGPSGG